MKETAISAANCHRAIDVLTGEFEKMESANPRSIQLFERFLQLHSEFYMHIIELTAEDSGEIDEDFRKEVQEEVIKLKDVVQYLKEERGFFEVLKGKVTGRSNSMADYFARCVADIFEGYAIDMETNEIFFCQDS